MDVSPWDDVSCTFMIQIRPWTLTSRSNLGPIGFMAWFCVRATAFCLWHCHTMFGTWVYHHGTICCIHSWPLYDLDLWPQYQNLYFHHEFKSGKIVFALWHRHTKVWHMSVLRDNMLCTFLTFEWSWHLTYMWVKGGILSESYSQFFILFCMFLLGFCVNHAVIYMYFGFNYRWSKHPVTIFDNHDLPWLFHLWSFLVSIFSNWG